MDYLKAREIYHHGIKGQKWGVRRYQNPDGTLTAEGRARYFNKDGSMSDDQMNEFQNEWNKNIVGALQASAKKRNPNGRPESTGKNWDEAHANMQKEIEKAKKGEKSILDDCISGKVNIDDFLAEYYVKAAFKDYGLSDKEIPSALRALDETRNVRFTRLSHSGIKGQKWGMRRYQNEDGTLTEEGKVRYSKKTKGVVRGTLGGAALGSIVALGAAAIASIGTASYMYLSKDNSSLSKGINAFDKMINAYPYLLAATVTGGAIAGGVSSAAKNKKKEA